MTRRGRLVLCGTERRGLVAASKAGPAQDLAGHRISRRRVLEWPPSGRQPRSGVLSCRRPCATHSPQALHWTNVTAGRDRIVQLACDSGPRRREPYASTRRIWFSSTCWPRPTGRWLRHRSPSVDACLKSPWPTDEPVPCPRCTSPNAACERIDTRITTGRRAFAGLVEMGELIRSQAPANRAQVVARLAFVADADGDGGRHTPRARTRSSR